MGFVNRVVSFFPALKSELRIAHLPYTPIQYVNKNLKETALYAFISTILFFFVLQKAKLPFLLLAPIFIILFILIFEYSLLRIKAKIRQREREINKEVTFVGRYLLVKLYSGRPLLNALIETASSRGIASKYIKEVVYDIDTRNTIKNTNTDNPHKLSGKLMKLDITINIATPSEGRITAASI